MQESTVETETRAAGVLVAVAVAVAVALVTSGCGALGVKRFETFSGGPTWDFYPGIDAHIGMNAIDQVDDSRGVDSRDSVNKSARPKESKERY